MSNIITRFNLFLEKYTSDGNTQDEISDSGVTWIDKKRNQWSTDLESILMSFNDVILSGIEDIKEKFDDKDNPNEVKVYYIELFESAYDAIIECIKTCQDIDSCKSLWYEFKLCNTFWKETFKRMSDKSENLDSVYRLGEEMFNIFNVYLTKSINAEIDDIIGKLNISNMSTDIYNIVDFLEKTKTDILLRIENIDAEKTFDETSLEDKSIDDIDLNPGDSVRYYKKDDSEGLAFVSNNQEDLETQSSIRLISKKDGEVIVIDKTQLIEILPKDNSIDAEVAELMKDIKGDDDKLKHVRTFLQKIKELE